MYMRGLNKKQSGHVTPLCVAVRSPCAERNGGCMHTCRNDGGRALCECNHGYQLAEDNRTCEGKQSRQGFATEYSSHANKSIRNLQASLSGTASER